jgi:hypothetical protein
MAIVRLKEGHTGATHMSHQQNTGRGRTAFTSELLLTQEKPRKCYRERTRERSLHQQVTENNYTQIYSSVLGRGRESAAFTGK